MRRVLVLVAALALAGCGGAGESGEEATLWVTRDRGERVLLVRTVPAGLTAMQALDREADIETRHGGRFVTGIDGLQGSLAGRRDWFYFVNGYEMDLSAVEYRLHPGDVLWWDFRSWSEQMRVPVVVGAFPEPFLHGLGGKRRSTYVRAETPAALPAARALARVVRGKPVARAVALPGINVITVTRSPARFRATGRTAGGPVSFTISRRDAFRLAENPRLARFRYEGLR